jgi:hypothetical protein
VSARALPLLLLVGLCGCAHVPAWERERLAHPAMQESADPEAEAFDHHVHGAREAAVEPGAVAGGGCGCN